MRLARLKTFPSKKTKGQEKIETKNCETEKNLYIKKKRLITKISPEL